MNPLPIVLIIRHFSHTHSSLWINTSLVSSSKTFTEQLRWKLSFSTSLLQRFTAESSRELRRNAPTGNKQRQV